MNKQIRFHLTIGLLLIVLGLFLGYEPFMRYRREQNARVNAQTQVEVPHPMENQSQPTKRIEGKPVRIVVSGVGIDLPVADGHFNAGNNSWTLSTDKAHYALITTMPNNQGGNTFIYGHNRKNVFTTLPRVKPGETAKVYTNNGHVFTYVYQSMRETTPTDDSLFRYQGKPILTLQTCTGLWYQNRSLYTFALQEVK